jgi:ABC-type spermidine/putrescine transport system permease subunit II
MGVTAQSSPITQLSTQTGAALHLFAFSTWFGTMVYTTFIFGITAFKNLPRQTFGKLQAKLFPKYFSLGSICLVLQVCC